MSTEAPKKKRRKPAAVTPLAVSDLRAMGFTCDKVEQRIPGCFITRDFIGCVDVIAFRPGFGILGVQVTGGENHSKRVLKSIAEPRLRAWLQAGGRFEVWSYDKRLGDGTKKKLKLRRQEIKLDDLPPEPPTEPVQVGVGNLFNERSLART